MTWAVAILCVAAVVAGVALVPSVRRGAVQREAAKVARAAYPAQPDDDWPALWTRLDRRYVSSWLGSSVGFVVVGLTLPAMSAETTAATGTFFGLLTVSAGRTMGTIAGHLRDLGHRPGMRWVVLHRRELRDYLVPAEAVLLRLAPAVPLSAIVFGVALSSGEAVSRTHALGIAAGGAMGLALGLLAVPLARRTLTAPADATTAGGLVWAELLRAMTLRDVCAGTWSLAAAGAGLPVLVLFTEGGEVDPWVIVPGVAICLSAATMVCGLAWVAASDINHQWARRHALAGGA